MGRSAATATFGRRRSEFPPLVEVDESANFDTHRSNVASALGAAPAAIARLFPMSTIRRTLLCGAALARPTRISISAAETVAPRQVLDAATVCSHHQLSLVRSSRGFLVNAVHADRERFTDWTPPTGEIGDSPFFVRPEIGKTVPARAR